MKGSDSVATEIHAQAIASAAKLKVKALSLLAEGGGDATWRAVVLLHEARRAERRAATAAAPASAETRLRSAVEQCGCLVDGRDPTAVLEVAWGEVLEASGYVPPSLAASIRRRLEPRVDALILEYSDLANASPEFFSTAVAFPPTASDAARTAREQGERLCQTFPGDARLWMVTAGLRLTTGDREAAWLAIRAARTLEPDDGLVRSTELYIAVRALPWSPASEVVEAAYNDALRGSTDSDVCVALATELCVLADGAPDPREWWERAAEIASLGLTLPPLHPRDRTMFRLVQLSVRELLAGRRPTVDLLYRVGLGVLVPRIPEKDRGDLLRAVSDLARAA